MLIAEINDLILILAAPMLFTSSILSSVYILEEPESISATWSVVTASRPQPKELS